MNNKKTFFTIILLFILSITFGQIHKAPPMNGTMPNMENSGWRVIRFALTGKPLAASSDEIVFCRASHFSYIPASGIGPQGTFKVAGNFLTLISSSSDKTTSVYKMTWNKTSNVLRLEGNGVIMELIYNGISNCDG